MPFESTTPADLPQGVSAPSQLGSALQDQSKAKFKSLAASRFPSVVNGTSAGNPADVAGPLGFVVDLFAGFAQNVAQSDPAAIQGPDDLHELVTDFFDGLPLVGVLIDIRDAMMGNYEGDDPVLQAIDSFMGSLAGLVNTVQDFVHSLVDAILQAIRGIPVVGGTLADIIADVGNLNDTAVTAHSAATAAEANTATLAENINSATTGGSAGGSGAIADAFDTIASIFGIADAAQKTAMAAQQQLQDITESTPEGGFSWSTIFAGSDGAALSGTDWPTGSSQIVIRGDDGYVGIQSGSANGVYHKLSAYSYVTDTQSVSTVLGDRPPLAPGYDTGLCLRCNSDMTTGAYCLVDRESVMVGKFTRSGSSWTYTPFTTQSIGIGQGDIIRFRASGDNYFVQVNGITRVSVTDTGATVAQGASYRRAGFLQQRGTQAFLTVDSFRMASFAMSDWVPAGAGVTAASWRLRRGSGDEVGLSVGAGGQSVMPSGFYTVEDLASAVTVTDLGTGQVTITESGWYEISASSINRDDSSDASTTSVGSVRSYHRTADAYRPTLWVLYVDGTAIAGPIMSGVPTTVYLAAGQVVRPGVSASWPLTPATAGGDSSTYYMVGGVSAISGVSGSPSASFTGRKVAS
ncbi:hypothetical protein [Gordonia tangerina]|uniref:Minor tail protein n=1 Tax=Gordonia tangerina TaxID=2911060 RepID=A0ABS9DQ12_9ACTN|nr:hypothetical protein [Gordonia tangerina]MCF3941307.1 hypothetical protein [Gordonia tangerina]